MPDFLQLNGFIYFHKSRAEMSDYNWCHGPECHTSQTQSRIRGSGDNKVLRTRRIIVYQPQTPHIYDFFCNQSCLMEYIRLHLTSIIAIAPRREALETPIKDPYKETIQSNWGNHSLTKTRIEVDNSNG